MLPISLELISETMMVTGEVLIGLMALNVHRRFLHEHQVDEEVFTVMKKEQFMGVIGIGLLVSGFVIHVIIM